MPVDFLTTEQKAKYGQFPHEPSEAQLARFFHLDQSDFSNSRSEMLYPSQNIMENFREFGNALNQRWSKNLKNLGYTRTQELRHNTVSRMY